MGDVTKDLSRWEWACQCGCGFDDLHPDAVTGVQGVRDHLGVAVAINSGCRCRTHNKNEGGGARSQHLPNTARYGRAVDLSAAVTLLDLYTAVCSIPAFAKGGIGVYFDKHGARVHADVRGRKARWGVLHGEKVSILAVLTAAS